MLRYTPAPARGGDRSRRTGVGMGGSGTRSDQDCLTPTLSPIIGAGAGVAINHDLIAV